MDFTGQFSFSDAHQPYHQFMPIPPLTPSHSHSGPSDDYNNSPPAAFDGTDASQFQGLDYPFPHQQHPQQQSQQPFQQTNGFPPVQQQATPPTPPGQTIYTQQQALSAGPAISGPNLDSISPDLQNGKTKTDSDELEEENLTPAQAKRKAQNRIAQRNFRERKEKHVKELETQLADLQAAQRRSSAEMDRLKRDLQRMTTENEILKATSGNNPYHQGSQPYRHRSTSSSSSRDELLTTGPQRYSPTDFASNILSNHPNKTFSHRIVESSDGQRLLAAGAAWDVIISHDLFKGGLVDIGTVSEHLKTRAVCDGQGPVFSERDVLQAIELSVASGTDDLL